MTRKVKAKRAGKKEIAAMVSGGTLYLYAKPIIPRMADWALSRKIVEFGWMPKGSEPGSRARPWGIADPVIAEIPGTFEDEVRLMERFEDLHVEGEGELWYRWDRRIFAAFGIAPPSAGFMKKLGAERVKAAEAARRGRAP